MLPLLEYVKPQIPIAKVWKNQTSEKILSITASDVYETSIYIAEKEDNIVERICTRKDLKKKQNIYWANISREKGFTIESLYARLCTSSTENILKFKHTYRDSYQQIIEKSIRTQTAPLSILTIFKDQGQKADALYHLLLNTITESVFLIAGMNHMVEFMRTDIQREVNHIRASIKTFIHDNVAVEEQQKLTEMLTPVYYTSLCHEIYEDFFFSFADMAHLLTHIIETGPYISTKEPCILFLLPYFADTLDFQKFLEKLRNAQ